MERAYCKALLCILIIYISGRAERFRVLYLLCRTTCS